MALAAATQTGRSAFGVGPANIERVDLGRAAELLLAGREHSQRTILAPSCWLAGPDRLGKAHRRSSLFGLLE